MGNSWNRIGQSERQRFFSIEVLDLAGNKGSPVTATDDNTQVVLDTTTPTLSDITLVSTNANDTPGFAKPGDNITLSFNSSEPIQTPVIVLADNDSPTVHDTSSNQDGTSWKVVYTVTAEKRNVTPPSALISRTLRAMRERAKTKRLHQHHQDRYLDSNSFTG